MELVRCLKISNVCPWVAYPTKSVFHQIVVQTRLSVQLMIALCHLFQAAHLYSATENKFSSAVSQRQYSAIQRFSVQKSFFAMMLKSRSHSIVRLQQRCFSHFLSALAVTPKQTSRLLPQNRTFPILKEKIRLLKPFYKDYFWFETGKYSGF